MILPIYLYGQAVLRKVAEDITPDYPELNTLIENMFETMHNAEGIGLAAPQIGLPIRLVVIDLDVLSDDFPEFKDFRNQMLLTGVYDMDELQEVIIPYFIVPAEPVKTPAFLKYLPYVGIGLGGILLILSIIFSIKNR